MNRILVFKMQSKTGKYVYFTLYCIIKKINTKNKTVYSNTVIKIS